MIGQDAPDVFVDPADVVADWVSGSMAALGWLVQHPERLVREELDLASIRQLATLLIVESALGGLPRPETVADRFRGLAALPPADEGAEKLAWGSEPWASERISMIAWAVAWRDNVVDEAERREADDR